jgi:hypothetical protein
MSQEEMLKNQVLEEILRERSNYYYSKLKSLDFWILISPDFLSFFDKKIKNSNFFQNYKKRMSSNINSSFFSVLITSNKEFLEWIKLRIGYFEDLNSNYNPNNYTIDGLYGVIEGIESASILNSNNNILDPKLLIQKYTEIINTIL